MKRKLRGSVRYHLIAIVPTLVGLCIITLGFYLIFVDPIMSVDEVIPNSEETGQNSSNSYPIIGIVLVIIGYLLHRLGRSCADIMIGDSDNEEPSAKEKEPELMVDYEDD